MRRVVRAAIAGNIQAYLDRRSTRVEQRRVDGSLDIEEEWKGARQTKRVQTALRVLYSMAGVRERCMYCVDSHGSDIDHFWPKTAFPERAFRWDNFLLCCTECGRFKGNRFPLADGQPLLINPSEEDPWTHLDFDPQTGNIVARYDVQNNSPSPKGVATVKLFQLDRRESIAEGNRRTYSRLAKVISDSLAQNDLEAAGLIVRLKEADDHGLLGWCLAGPGSQLEPFATLHSNHADVWAACVDAV